MKGSAKGVGGRARRFGVRTASWLALAMAVGVSVGAASATGCSKKRSREEDVADAFVDLYLKADQQGAMKYASLSAATQLRRELLDAKEARSEGAVADVHATFKRLGSEKRDARTVLRYQVILDPSAKTKDTASRTLRVELADLGDGPKVVLYEIR